jgi:small subunit ribosomal protein S17
MKGTIISNKMTKALVVAVSRTMKHSMYLKSYKLRKKYHVACSDSSKFQIGAEVEIQECNPVSKTIAHRVVES